VICISYPVCIPSSGPPLWSSGQSSWLQIQRSGFDLRGYHIFWEVVGLERGSLSLVSATEELLGRNSSGSRLKSRQYGRRGSVVLTTWHLLSSKVGKTSPTSGCRSVGIVRSRTQATQFSLVYNVEWWWWWWWWWIIEWRKDLHRSRVQNLSEQAKKIHLGLRTLGVLVEIQTRYQRIASQKWDLRSSKRSYPKI
jgi:hypothetical protein